MSSFKSPYDLAHSNRGTDVSNSGATNVGKSDTASSAFVQLVHAATANKEKVANYTEDEEGKEKKQKMVIKLETSKIYVNSGGWRKEC